MSTNKQLARQQQGFSKVELSLTVVLAIVVMLASLYAIERIWHAKSVNQQVSEVSQVLGKIKRQYQMQSNTLGVSVNTLAPLGVWPPERLSKVGDNWKVSGVVKGSSEHIFSNSTAINSIAAHQGFIYSLHNLPEDMCAEVIKGLEKTVFAIYVAPSASAILSEAVPTGVVVKGHEDVNVQQGVLTDACQKDRSDLVTISFVKRLSN